MQIIDTDATRRALAFEPVIATLRAAFAGGYTVPPRHVHSLASGDRHGTSSSCRPGARPAISA